MNQNRYCLKCFETCHHNASYDPELDLITWKCINCDYETKQENEPGKRDTPQDPSIGGGADVSGQWVQLGLFAPSTNRGVN